MQLFLNPRVVLTTGKAAAQVGHAAQLVLQSIPADRAAEWVAAGAPVRVVPADEDEWDRLLTTAPVVVTDGGFTEVAPGPPPCRDPSVGASRLALLLVCLQSLYDHKQSTRRCLS